MRNAKVGIRDQHSTTWSLNATDAGNITACKREGSTALHDIGVRVHLDIESLAEHLGRGNIDRPERTVSVRDLRTGNSRTERYQALVLSPGAAPIRPSLPGVDLPGVFAVRNIPDSRRIRSWIADRRVSTAVIVGGGFIGLEMVET